MARKPAQTKAQDKTPDADAQIGADADTAMIHADAAGPTDTEAGDTATAAADNAQGANEHAQTGGEERTDLTAAVAALADNPPPILPEGVDLVLVGVDLAAAKPEWIVTCHREEGRRRAGRSWPKGDTPVTVGELSAYDLASLQGDPQFSVRRASQD